MRRNMRFDTKDFQVLILIGFLALAIAVPVSGADCTLRVGGFHAVPDGISGMADRPSLEEIIEGVGATAISKTSKKTYNSYEIDGLRYFEKLPEGSYRIVLSAPRFATSYEPYELNCGSDPWHVATWYFRMWPGNPRTIKNNDPESNPIKEMRLDRLTRLGSFDSDTAPLIAGGEALALPEPRLSARARNANFTGIVRVRVFVSTEGKVTKASAISGHPSFLSDCETAAYYSTFSPRTINGRPVSFFTRIDYPFGDILPPETVSGGVLNGKALSLPKPAYPPAAKAVKASGSVTVQVLIDENGNITSASAVSGHPLLRAAAEAAARGARFSQTLIDGKAVKVSGVIVYNFVP